MSHAFILQFVRDLLFSVADSTSVLMEEKHLKVLIQCNDSDTVNVSLAGLSSGLTKRLENLFLIVSKNFDFDT